MAEAAVEVAQDADDEGAEGGGDLRAGGEALGAEVVGDVTGEGDQEHDGDLAPFGLVDEREAEGEEDDEGKVLEVLVADRAGGAGVLGRGVRVEQAIHGGADRDAEPEEQRVDNGVDHAHGAGDDAARLQFQTGAQHQVSGQDQRDR